MIKFLRISSIYPSFLKKIDNSINKRENYDNILKTIFNLKYSVSNYLSEELSKRNYECNEIIHNYDLIQNKWINEYGNIQNEENVIVQQKAKTNPKLSMLVIEKNNIRWTSPEKCKLKF